MIIYDFIAKFILFLLFNSIHLSL